MARRCSAGGESDEDVGTVRLDVRGNYVDVRRGLRRREQGGGAGSIRACCFGTGAGDGERRQPMSADSRTGQPPLPARR